MLNLIVRVWEGRSESVWFILKVIVDAKAGSLRNINSKRTSKAYKNSSVIFFSKTRKCFYSYDVVYGSAEGCRNMETYCNSKS